MKMTDIMRKINIILGFFLAIGLSSCFKLDRTPEGVLSTVNSFTTTGEMQNYINQFYETAVRMQNMTAGGGSGICGTDINSDNMAASSPVTRINGGLSVADAVSLTNYTYIRNVNFFLNNLDNYPDPSQAAYKQLVGEGYYFRAWYYYQLLVNYGPVSIVKVPLDPDSSQMKLERDSRLEVADFIIGDLKLAIENLSEQNSSATMRIHRDVARALLSEVALFEGTWEKYHKAANDKFFDPAVTDAKINSYLQTAADAAKAVMDRNVWKISTVGGADAYRQLFATEDLSSNSEVLWFKRYDGSVIGNSVDRYLNTGGAGVGVTASLVDDYLTINGEPFVGIERDNAKKHYGDELLPTVRDPRLAQTVAAPGQKIHPDGTVLQYSPLNGNGSAYGTNTTGYSILKHNQIDYAGNVEAENKGSTPAIQFRYADVLLNYAEALAELGGAANASKIIEAVQPLRDRAGMPAMDFDREYNTDPSYAFRGLDKYIQAVRRERRVEQAIEGRRLQDILRWAAADKLLRGWWPTGAKYVGTDLEEHFRGQLTIGESILVNSSGDILPLNPDNAAYSGGYGFNLDRDYLLPIQERMISLTSGLWTQNPGW